MPSDETWDADCDCLETHPTLQVLNLRSMVGLDPLVPAVLKSRIQALVDMLKMNTSKYKLYSFTANMSFSEGRYSLSRDEPAPSMRSYHPENPHDSLPCQGARKSTSVSSFLRMYPDWNTIQDLGE
jgi:hypothetical protein